MSDDDQVLKALNNATGTPGKGRRLLSAGLATAAVPLLAYAGHKGYQHLKGKKKERVEEIEAELAAGRSNKEIARALGLSPNTVKTHLANLYAKLGWDTEFWPLGPTGFGVDYTQGDNISSEGADGTSYGLAAVQRIDRYGIDLYAQIRRYELDQTSDPELNNVTVGTFGTKFTF